MAAALVLTGVHSAAWAASAAETVIYSFTGGNSYSGAYPSALIAVGGTFFGETYYGGLGYGSVFSVTPSGQQTVLYNFLGGSDGEGPNGGLLNVDGVLYGATEYGGEHNYGTVFRLLRDGTKQTIHSFGAYRSDARNPAASLIAVNGTFYGTGVNGGAYGAIYSIAPDGTEAVFHSFDGAVDGAFPEAPFSPSPDPFTARPPEAESPAGVPYSASRSRAPPAPPMGAWYRR